MDQNPGGIDAVVGVSSDVVTAFRDDAFFSCRGEALGDDQPGKSCADDQKVSGCVCLQGVGWMRIDFSSYRPWSILPCEEET
jgi:hypothetical protein